MTITTLLLILWLFGFILVFGGSRLIYYMGDRKWTIEVRWKSVSFALFSWITIVVVLLVLLWEITLGKLKIDWNKEVKI